MTTGIRSGSASSGTMQVARAGLHREGADQGADDRDAGVGEHEDQHQRGDAPAPGVGPEQQQPEGGHRDDLDRGQEAEQRQRLGHQQRRAVDRRQQEPVEPALLVVGDEQAAGPEHGGEQQRHPQHAGGEIAVDLPALQREVEDARGW